ncbi:MAG: NAD(P)-binding domain-containing protein [Gammaproteobacteria bacterium]
MNSEDEIDFKVGVLGATNLASILITRLIEKNIRVHLLLDQKRIYFGAGAKYFVSQCEIVKASDIIITICQDGPELENVLFGNNGIAQVVTGETLIIDMSTVSPELIKEISEQLNEYGWPFLDATVISEKQMEFGLIQMMLVGGDKYLYDKVLPVLSRIAENVRHIGENGASQFYRQAFAVRAKI